MTKNADRNLTAIFCDDIRHEMGNKMSFMGCYQNELNVANAPVALAKFRVYASITTPLSKPFKELTLRVVQGDDIELAQMEIPTEQLQPGAVTVDPTATRRILSTAIMFAPFVIEKPTSIRLTARTEEGEIIGPRLLIKVAENPSLQQTTAPVLDKKNEAKASTRKSMVKRKVAPTRKP